MSDDSTFSLADFLPYLLNQAAEAASAEFEAHYRARYGMLRTEWRVLFHLGLYGEMTAKRICEMGHLHKTKVSRAVRALEDKRYLGRTADQADRRHETLSLTTRGRTVFAALGKAAAEHDAKLTEGLSRAEARMLRAILSKVMANAAERRW